MGNEKPDGHRQHVEEDHGADEVLGPAEARANRLPEQARRQVSGHVEGCDRIDFVQRPAEEDEIARGDDQQPAHRRNGLDA